MTIDNNSTNTIRYVDSNTVRVGQGPEAWQSTTITAHQEMWGAATFGALRNLELSSSEPSPEPTPIVEYEKCTSSDTGALLVIADGTDPVGNQINIRTVKAGGLTDVEIGDYVRAID